MSDLDGSELLVRCLKNHDIEYFFNIVGFGIFPLVETIHAHRDDIKYISGVNELGVALTAEGYARATRAPAFLNLYHSSGTALAMVALTIAWADRTPLILTTTTSSQQLSRRDQYAAVPRSITEMTRQYTKWDFEVPSAERIPDAIDRAIATATSPPMGPVHLAFPMDIYESEVDQSKIDQRHGQSSSYRETTADEQGLQETARLLRDAELPVIAAGSEVGQYYATDPLVDIAEMLGAPVVSEQTRVYLPFPSEHPQYVGHLPLRYDLLRQADVVLAVGFEFTEKEYGEVPLRNTNQRLVQIATDSSELGKQIVPDIGLSGHLKPTLETLSEFLSHDSTSANCNERPEAARKWAEKTEEEISDLCEILDTDSGTSVMRTVVKTLPEVFGDDLVVVNHAVSGSPYLRTLDFRTADELYGISGKASAQGWGTGAAIGIQLAEPSKNVVAFVGDGGFLFSAPSALYTAVQHDIPVTIITISDEGWGGGGYNFKIDNGEEGDLFMGGFSDPPINIVDLASSMGVISHRLETVSEVKNTLETVKQQERPAVLEVPIRPENIREYHRKR